MDKKRKFRLLVASMGFTIFLMAWTSFGSFNPTSIGFWLCILNGVFWYTLLYFFFKKYTVSDEKQK